MCPTWAFWEDMTEWWEMDCEAGDKLFWKHRVSEGQEHAEMKGNKDQVAHDGALLGPDLWLSAALNLYWLFFPEHCSPGHSLAWSLTFSFIASDMQSWTEDAVIKCLWKHLNQKLHVLFSFWLKTWVLWVWINVWVCGQGSEWIWKLPQDLLRVVLIKTSLSLGLEVKKVGDWKSALQYCKALE